MEEIVSKADGVFLCAVLIVKSLLDGLTNRDSIEDLQRRLRLLPTDLESLYQHVLFFRINRFYRRKASELFQTVRATLGMSESLEHDGDVGYQLRTVLLLSMAMEPDRYTCSDSGLSHYRHPLRAPDISTRRQVMEGRLKCYSASILEVQASSHLTGTSEAHKAEATAGRVQFLHRTIRDYLEQLDVWDAFLVYTNGTAFSPHASLLNARILYLKLVEHSGHGLGELGASIICITHAHHAEITTRKSYASLLDELDRTMASYFSQASSTTGLISSLATEVYRPLRTVRF